MATRPNLDMDVLRTFVAGFELGSFARAASQLGRSQSALSTQLRKLEAQVGQPLVRKAGRALELTEAGERLFGYARRILALNDEAFDALRGGDVEGVVRVGLPQDLAETWLPPALARFARAHPRVRVEVRADRNARLSDALDHGELDLALTWEDPGLPLGEAIAEVGLAWIGPRGWRPSPGEPLSLAMFEPPCVFRGEGLARLDAAGLPWRVAFTSPSLAGLWAAVRAGLAVTLRTEAAVPADLAILDPATTGLPVLPRTRLVLRGDGLDPAAERLAEILKETVVETLGVGGAR